MEHVEVASPSVACGCTRVRPTCILTRSSHFQRVAITAVVLLMLRYDCTKSRAQVGRGVDPRCNEHCGDRSAESKPARVNSQRRFRRLFTMRVERLFRSGFYATCRVESCRMESSRVESSRVE